MLACRGILLCQRSKLSELCQHLQLSESIRRRLPPTLFRSLTEPLTLSSVDSRRVDHFRGAAGIIEEVCLASGTPFSRLLACFRVSADPPQFQVTQSDSVEEQENSEDIMGRLASRTGI